MANDDNKSSSTLKPSDTLTQFLEHRKSHSSGVGKDAFSQTYDLSFKDELPNVFSVLKNDGIADLRQVSTNMNYGFNHAHQAMVQTSNKFDKGYVFFTRPQLALDDGNLLKEPRLYSFLTKNRNGVHRYVRCLLDPRLSYTYSSTVSGKAGEEFQDAARGMFDVHALGKGEEGSFCSPMLDNTNPFITLFSNCLKSLSGWPDPSSGFFVTEPNVGGGQTVIVDKHNRERGVFSLSATFNNPPGNALVLALWLWREVQSLTWEGILDPYPDFIVNNLMNYKTGIYRFVMDEHRRRIILPMKTIGTLDAPDIGRLGDYQQDMGKLREDLDINVNFRCEGVDYFNPYILIEFNLTMAIGDPAFARLVTYDITTQFNPAKRQEVLKSCHLEVVPPELKDYFNFRAKPYVNLNTLELEWIVSTDSVEYQYLLNKAIKAEEKIHGKLKEFEEERKATEAGLEACRRSSNSILEGWLNQAQAEGQAENDKLANDLLKATGNKTL